MPVSLAGQLTGGWQYSPRLKSRLTNAVQDIKIAKKPLLPTPWCYLLDDFYDTISFVDTSIEEKKQLSKKGIL